MNRRPKFIFLLVLALALVLILPSFALSETLFSPTGDDNVPVIVFKSENSMQEAIKFLNSGGSIFNYKIFGQYVRAIPDSGTPCIVLKSKLGKREVKITGGPHSGKVGWVTSEMVR